MVGSDGGGGKCVAVVMAVMVVAVAVVAMAAVMVLAAVAIVVVAVLAPNGGGVGGSGGGVGDGCDIGSGRSISLDDPQFTGSLIFLFFKKAFRIYLRTDKPSYIDARTHLTRPTMRPGL